MIGDHGHGHGHGHGVRFSLMHDSMIDSTCALSEECVTPVSQTQ